MKKMARGIVILVLLGLLAAITGCGGKQADVPIFIMPEKGMASDQAQLLQQWLEQKLGPAPTVEVKSVPIFSMEKMIVEVAAGGNGLIIVPKEQFIGLTNQGGATPLEELADPKQYPDGVLEDPQTHQKHLYGVPMSGTAWFKQARYSGSELYAFIPSNSPNLEAAKQVLKLVISE